MTARFDADRLTAFAARCLEGVGSDAVEAQTVAAHLVGANLTGHDSHGIGVLPLYVQHAQEGKVAPNAPRSASGTGAVVHVDGANGFGAMTGRLAVAEGAPRAKDHGVALVLTGNTHHLGRIGGFAEMAAEQGLVFISFVNVSDHDGIVAPYRGRDGRFGTNPVTIAAPATAGHGPAVLDMATSRIAVGKARVALDAGKKVPFGSLLDENGDPTDDPSGMGWGGFKGALVPFAEHKGYALAFMAELLGGALSGAGTIQPGNPRSGGVKNGMTTVLIDPAACGDWEAMAAEIDAFTEFCLASPPQDPAEPVLAPGEPERLARAERAEHGVPLADGVLERLNQAAEAAGIDDRL